MPRPHPAFRRQTPKFDQMVGWNTNTRLYHLFSEKSRIATAHCESGTILTITGQTQHSERQPCPKCFLV